MAVIQSVYAAFTSVVAAVVSIFGVNMGTEQPRYDVLERIGDNVEIRQYRPRVAAETIVDTSKSDNARGDAFRLIAGYIFGANKTSKKVAMTSPVEISPPGTTIAMTAPVEVNKSGSGLVMRFFLPSKYSIDQLPEPSDPRVKLTQIPSATVAVLRFSGSTGDPAVTIRTAELISALQSTKWKVAGPSTAFFYNPPWTIPFLRTNEVVITVTQ